MSLLPTATLACASTRCAMGVSSKWKNLIMFPARIGYAILTVSATPEQGMATAIAFDAQA